MAIIKPAWSYWWCAFWAMLLLPLSIDGNNDATFNQTPFFAPSVSQRADTVIFLVIFTVANLLITDVFPTQTQALAGAVFNTAAQLGTSIGIAIMAVVSTSVTDQSSIADKTSPEALMQGYRAVFWACLALMLLTTFMGLWGLRRVKKVGVHTK